MVAEGPREDPEVEGARHVAAAGHRARRRLPRESREPELRDLEVQRPIPHLQNGNACVTEVFISTPNP